MLQMVDYLQNRLQIARQSFHVTKNTRMEIKSKIIVMGMLP
jgi:hypothetical protein